MKKEREMNKIDWESKKKPQKKRKRINEIVNASE